MYGELGRLPMCIRRQLSITKYWLKILQSHENSLLFKTYKMLKNDVVANKTYNKTNWAYHIKLLLYMCGLSYLWINQFNTRIHFNTIKSRTLAIFKQSWYSTYWKHTACLSMTLHLKVILTPNQGQQI